MKKTFTRLLITSLLGSQLLSLAPTTAAQESGNLYDTYSVEKGDTLYKIAKLLGTTPEVLLEFNGLNSTIIFPQQDLLIPPHLSYVVKDGKYIVRKGDTLYAIANHTGTTVNALKSKNNLTSHYIYPGQVLYIPEIIDDDVIQATQDYYIYTVKPGDTLYTIGKKHHISVEAIKAINQLNSDIIFPGRQLNLDPHVDDGSMSTLPPANKVIKHTVQAGDTLYALAKQYHTKVYAIQRDNDLPSTHIEVGQVLTISQY